MPTERRAACWLGVGEELSRAGPWAGTPPWTLIPGPELSTTRSVNQQRFSLLRYCTSHWGLKQNCEILNGFRYWYCWSLLVKELYYKELIKLRNLFLWWPFRAQDAVTNNKDFLSCPHLGGSCEVSCTQFSAYEMSLINVKIPRYNLFFLKKVKVCNREEFDLE